MANGFIKKNWQKDATANLIQSGARIAGGTVTAWGLQKFFGPTKSDGTDNKTMHNIGGPLMLALGVLGDMMLESPNLRAVCQGITTYAGLHSIAVISPAPNGLAPKLGLAGLGGAAEDAALMSGIGRTHGMCSRSASNYRRRRQDLQQRLGVPRSEYRQRRPNHPHRQWPGRRSRSVDGRRHTTRSSPFDGHVLTQTTRIY